jgi:sodium transport system ATP-binding protein
VTAAGKRLLGLGKLLIASPRAYNGIMSSASDQQPRRIESMNQANAQAVDVTPTSKPIPSVLPARRVMIELNDLTKTFYDPKRGLLNAVDHVSLVAYAGEVLGLLGPNGAGKTTTLRILCTVLRPTSGTARVAGYDTVTQADFVRESVGFLSANTGVYDRMTAYEFVRYYGQLHGLAADRLEARIDEIFSLLQMNHFRHTQGAKMSTGMKQKVSIARALIHDPPVLIFDEPTAGLDVLVQRAVLDAVAGLRSLGKCILFSTHIMREVEKLCDRVAIMDQGRILTVGTLPELYQRFGCDDLEAIFFSLVKSSES